MSLQKAKSNVVIIVILICLLLMGCESKNYKYANDLFEEGNYLAAIDAFTELDDYKDSKERLLECQYELAEIMCDEGDYQTAIDTYAELGEYKDSSTLRENTIILFLNAEIGKISFKVDNVEEIINFSKLCNDYDVTQELFAKLDDAVVFEQSFPNFIDEYCKNTYWNEAIEVIQAANYVSDDCSLSCLTTYGRWAAIDSAEEYIKEQLKSPRSYYRYDASVSAPRYDEENAYYNVNITLKYGATNSFGAEVTNTTELLVRFYVDEENKTVEFECVGDVLDMLKNALGR